MGRPLSLILLLLPREGRILKGFKDSVEGREAQRSI